MAQNYRRSLTKRRKARQGPAGGDFKNGLHLAKFEKRQPTFFQIYMFMSFTQLENHSQTRFTLEEIAGLVLPFIRKWTNPK